MSIMGAMIIVSSHSTSISHIAAKIVGQHLDSVIPGHWAKRRMTRDDDVEGFGAYL
jgi:hypothetical protein